MNHDEKPPIFPDSRPPIQQGVLEIKGRERTWPIFVGVIAIIFGALGLLGQGCGVVGQLMTATAFQGTEVEAMMPPSDMSTFVYGSMIVKAILAIMLLIGGILILSKLRTGVRIISAWAIIRLVLLVPEWFLGRQMQERMFEAMEANAPQNQNMPAGMMSLMGAGGMIIGIAFASLLPIGFLAWFLIKRDAIRAESADA